MNSPPSTHKLSTFAFPKTDYNGRQIQNGDFEARRGKGAGFWGCAIANAKNSL